MLIYAEMRGTYDRKVAYIFVHFPTMFEKIRLKIKEIKGHTLCNEISYLTLHLNVTQWFLAIFMEHRLNTQHSQLHV